MIFNAAVKTLPEIDLPEGFVLDNILPADLEKYNALRQTVNFSQWPAEKMETFHSSKVLKNCHQIYRYQLF